MKILVCGGRDYADRERVYDALDAAHRRNRITELIHGAAPGADILAGEWAEERKVACKPFPADWRKHGKSAGPRRNQQMLEYGPEGVIALPGGSGTRDMVMRAMLAKVPVWRPYG